MTKDIFAIDPGMLPEEWIEQPSLFKRWARKAADAREERDRMKAGMELVEAQVANRIRRNPAKYGFAKVTEPTIKEIVIASSSFQKAQKLYLQAKSNADHTEVAVSALDHRKRALEKLVDLVLSDYYSVPRKPKGENGRDLDDLVKRRIRSKKE